MKDYIRKIFIFQPYECKSVEDFLSKMSSKGWILDNIKGYSSTPYIFIFHRSEPKELTFSIDYFKEGSIYDEKAYIPTLDYIEYCEKVGWNHLCTKGKMQVFYTELKNPVPIQTDEKIKFKAINNAFLMQSSYIWLTILSIWFLIYQINSNFENLVSNYSLLLSVSVYILMLIISGYILIDYIVWRYQSINNLRTNGKLNLSSRKPLFTFIHLYIYMYYLSAFPL